jgi:poly(3-hydroxybutyrate) depolymerase
MGEVYFLDWTDARLVPKAFGDFGLEEQLAVVLHTLRQIDRPLHLVGVSQSGAVTLAAAALTVATADATRQPLSLSLLGTPIGESRTRSAADWLLASLEHVRLESQLISVVPDRYPGAGRRVYPGLLQLLGSPGAYDRMHGDLHRVADVPAELFSETIEQLVRQPALSAAGLRIGGHTIPATGLERLPILTIEAGRDELVGAGATHVARELGSPGSTALTIDSAPHYALFSGPAFASGVAPALRSFIGETS